MAANPEKWTKEIHVDHQVDTRAWYLHSFSLGLRALLHPCAQPSVDSPAVRAVAEHIDALWNEDQHGWADLPDLEATVSGSYAVVAAVHTLKKAWPFDPSRDLRVKIDKRPRIKDQDRSSSPATVTLYLIEAEQRVRVDDRFNETLVETRIQGPSQWAILLALARRRHDADLSGSNDENQKSLTLAECAELCRAGEGVKPETALRAIRRLQEKLAQDARSQTRLFRKLIEEWPGESSELRFTLERVNVRFVDTFPESSTDDSK